jgi:hypothetical protein
MASFHQVDPNGDVDLILPRLEEEVSLLDGALECLPSPPGLSFRRSKAQEPGPEPVPEPEPKPYTLDERPAGAEREPADETLSQLLS